MNKENITKKQHIVPQVHLKNFTILNKNKLECLNIDELRIEKTQSPKSICKGYFHYAMKPGKEDEYSQIVEKNFKNIETWYGENIERIKENIIKNNKINKDDKFGISWIIANFYFRGYKFRNKIKKTINKLIEYLHPHVSKNIYDEYKKQHPKLFANNKNFKQIVDDVIKNGLTSYTDNTAYATNTSFDVGFPNTLTHKKWQILINKSLIYPFITGDEAVIETSNKIIPKSISNSFLCLTHTFHLSPQIAIIATYPFNEKEHGKIIFEDISNNIPRIFQQNLLYINYTNKYCYSPRKDFFNWLINFEKIKFTKNKTLPFRFSDW